MALNILFRNAEILLPDGSSQFGALGVEDDIIAFVGDVPHDFKSEQIIDCEGNILMPGLVNTHTHLPMTLFRSMADDMPLQQWLETRIFPLEENLTDELCYWGTMLSMAEMMRYGVTSCNDMYSNTNAIAQAVYDSGMRALISRCLVGENVTAEQEAEQHQIYESWNGAASDRIRMAVSVHAEYTCSNDLIQRSYELSREFDVPFHIHVSETYQEHEECKERHGGKTPVQLLDSLGALEGSLLAHCVHVEMDDIARIAAKNAVILHNPQSNLKLGSGVAPLPVFLLHGCRVALGTDGAASNNNLDMWEEMRLAATLHKGISNNASTVPASMAFHMATAAGGDALGWNIGRLVPSAQADIVMVDRNVPNLLTANDTCADIVYAADGKDVLLTMVAGKILYERGHYYTIAYDEMKSHVQNICESLRDA